MTHKEHLRTRWFWGSLIASISLFVGGSWAMITRDILWVGLALPFVIFARFAFPTECQQCGARFNIPPGVRALDGLDFCQTCGLDLRTEILSKVGHSSQGDTEKPLGPKQNSRSTE